MINKGTKYFAQNVSSMNKVYKVIDNLRNARIYWATFNIGDKIEISYYCKVKAKKVQKHLFNCIIIHKNDYFMDVQSNGTDLEKPKLFKDKIITIRTEDLILERYKSMIKHA